MLTITNHKTSDKTIIEIFETLRHKLKNYSNWDLDAEESYIDPVLNRKVKVDERIVGTFAASSGTYPDAVCTDLLTGIEYKNLKSSNKPSFNSAMPKEYLETTKLTRDRQYILEQERKLTGIDPLEKLKMFYYVSKSSNDQKKACFIDGVVYELSEDQLKELAFEHINEAMKGMGIDRKYQLPNKDVIKNPIPQSTTTKKRGFVSSRYRVMFSDELGIIGELDYGELGFVTCVEKACIFDQYFSNIDSRKKLINYDNLNTSLVLYRKNIHA